MKTLKRRFADVVVLIINGFAMLLGKRFYAIFLDQITRKYHRFGKLIQIVIGDQNVYFACPNRLTRWRLNTFYTKEPATLKWIEGFSAGEVMWDIGANIGIYSIYAALTREITVFAFEPAPANYALLCENVELNKLNKQVTVFPIALNDKCEIGTLNMTTLDAGSSFSSFTATPSKKPSTISLLGYSIDEFIDTFQPPFPQHIKIDVDGIEDKILLGAIRTLKDVRLKTICVEGDESKPAQLSAIKKVMSECGFRLQHACCSPLYPKSPFQNLYFIK